MKIQTIRRSKWQACLMSALMVAALLVSGAMAAHAMNIPANYDMGYTGFFQGGAPTQAHGWDSGTGNSWYLDVSQFPATNYMWFYEEDQGQIIKNWFYTFGSGGAFTLAGPGGAQFDGTFTQGSGYSYEVSGGPPIFDSFDVEMYFKGQWTSGPDQGLLQAGVIDIRESGFEGRVDGPGSYTSGPAPEPNSLALFGSGILGLGGVLRKRLRRGF